MPDGPDMSEEWIAEAAMRFLGFVPKGCAGIYNAKFEVFGQDLFQNRSDVGKFPFRLKMYQGLHAVVHLIRAWRDPVPIVAPAFPQIQYGFVVNGGTPLVEPSFRLFDALEAFTLGAPVFQDSYTDYNQAVPQTDGQPWEFFVRNERIGQETPPYRMTCELIWGFQPTVRFRG